MNLKELLVETKSSEALKEAIRGYGAERARRRYPEKSYELKEGVG